MNIRKFKITKPVDIYGIPFQPELDVYDVIYTHELFVALGKDKKVLRLVFWTNVEEV